MIEEAPCRWPDQRIGRPAQTRSNPCAQAGGAVPSGMVGPGDVPGEFMDAPCPLCSSAARRTVVERCPDRLLGHPGEFAIVECRDCQVRYLAPRPVGETLVGYYRPCGERSYSDNESHRPKRVSAELRAVLSADRGYPEAGAGAATASGLAHGRKVLARFNDQHRLLPWRGAGRLLDVGAGGGAYLETMQSLGWKVEGTNVVPEVCADVRARLGVPCHHGELEALNLPPASYDAISLWHVLEHLPSPPKVLAEAKRLLAPGGILAIGVPVYDSPEAERLRDAWIGYDVPRHLLTFSRPVLRALVERMGFRVLGLWSEPRDRILRLSYERGRGYLGMKLLMRQTVLRRAYARKLSRQDRIGTVVLWAEPNPAP